VGVDKNIKKTRKRGAEIYQRICKIIIIKNKMQKAYKNKKNKKKRKR